MELTIHFHRRTPLSEKKVMGNIFVRVIYDQKHVEITLPETGLLFTEWDGDRQQVLRDKADKSRLVALRRIESALAEAHETFWTLAERLREEDRLSARNLVTAYQRRGGNTPFLPFAREQMAALRTAGKISSADSYRTAIRRFRQFFGSDNLLFRDITAGMIEDFEAYLQGKGLKPNTTSAYLRSLQAIYNKGVARGLADVATTSPFDGVYRGVAPTEKRALEASDISAIGQFARQAMGAEELKESKELEKLEESKESSAAIFFHFSFLAQGMSFVDMAFLKKENVSENAITYKRQKTGTPITVPLSDELKEVIRHFSAETVNSPYVFPIITKPGENEWKQYQTGLRRYNRSLGVLVELLSLKTPKLSSYRARHSWATFCKRLGIPLTMISEGLGHKNVATTSIYMAAHSLEELADVNRQVAAMAC